VLRLVLPAQLSVHVVTRRRARILGRAHHRDFPVGARHTEVHQDVQWVPTVERQAIKADISEVRSSTKAQIAEVKETLSTKIADVKADVVRWTLLSMLSMASLLAGAVYVLLQHLG